MEREMDREDYLLRILIERMQHEGHPEHEIEAAVRSASSRMRRAERPARRPARFGIRRLRRS